MALLPQTQLALLANKSSTCPELTSVVLQEVAREESHGCQSMLKVSAP